MDFMAEARRANVEDQPAGRTRSATTRPNTGRGPTDSGTHQRHRTRSRGGAPVRPQWAPQPRTLAPGTAAQRRTPSGRQGAGRAVRQRGAGGTPRPAPPHTPRGRQPSRGAEASPAAPGPRGPSSHAPATADQPATWWAEATGRQGTWAPSSGRAERTPRQASWWGGEGTGPATDTWHGTGRYIDDSWQEHTGSGASGSTWHAAWQTTGGTRPQEHWHSASGPRTGWASSFSGAPTQSGNGGKAQQRDHAASWTSSTWRRQ